MINPLKNFNRATITINTTEDCNLRCKYCYETCKKPNRNMDFQTAKKFIDLFLGCNGDLEKFTGVPNVGVLENDVSGFVIDFIGGDALINPKLLDEILTYLQYKLIMENHTWKNTWMISISTNGTLFERKDVRDFCEKWKDIMSIGVSIDGCPEIHDKNRVFPNGKGSMETIKKWLPWLHTIQPYRETKSTCNKDSIPYLFKSLKYMHEELGLNHIYQNFIMENMGLTEDDIIELDKQFEFCVNYVLEHCDEMYWSMIDRARFTNTINSSEAEEAICGAGNMLSLSIDGDIYPCFRWLPISQNNSDEWKIGDINSGIIHQDKIMKIRNGSKRCNCTKDEKCFSCEFESCCSYCIAGCYNENKDFIRTTHVCDIIKLQCKWAKYYWSEYEKRKND